MQKVWSPGDWAVYRKSKRSTSPGPRAVNVVASQKGESYTYVVDKFWVVESVLSSGQVLLRTPTGKTHLISGDDPGLRKPTFFQRLLWRHRFREAADSRRPNFAA
jgi:hypothetical protein